MVDNLTNRVVVRIIYHAAGKAQSSLAQGRTSTPMVVVVVAH